MNNSAKMRYTYRGNVGPPPSPPSKGGESISDDIILRGGQSREASKKELEKCEGKRKD